MVMMMRRWLIAAAVQLTIAACAAWPATAQIPMPRVHVIAFGLDGDHDLFRREAFAAADVITQHYGQSGQRIVRANTDKAFGASIAEMNETLSDLSPDFDKREDVLFLFMTSHGNQDGIYIKNAAAKQGGILSPRGVKYMLDQSGARYRVLIVSACYSGVFAEQIADDYTLVITAADSQHSSFGCSDDNRSNYTYFGQAFFGESFLPGVKLTDAFEAAKRRVAAREQAERLIGSNPQMRGGTAVKAQLERVKAMP